MATGVFCSENIYHINYRYIDKDNVIYLSHHNPIELTQIPYYMWHIITRKDTKVYANLILLIQQSLPKCQMHRRMTNSRTSPVTRCARPNG